MNALEVRALELADRWACEVILSECVPGDDQGVTWSFADAMGVEVHALCETPQEVQDAVQWVIDRGYGVLHSDDDDDTLILTTPFAEW